MIRLESAATAADSSTLGEVMNVLQPICRAEFMIYN